MVQEFNFKIVLAENIASDIQKKSYIKNHLNLCFSHRPRQHHKKCRHTQIPCFRLFQIGYRVRQSSKVLGARVQFFYQKILRQIIAKKLHSKITWLCALLTGQGSITQKMQRHTQIPCFSLFQIRYHVRYISKVFGTRIQF